MPMMSPGNRSEIRRVGLARPFLRSRFGDPQIYGIAPNFFDMTKYPFVMPQNANFAVSQAPFVMPGRAVRFSAFGLTNRGGAGLCA
jgi:hypothetical protein